MVKVGIITFHCADNYGAVLQCFALKKYLEGQFIGDVDIINYCPECIEGSYKFFDTYYKECLKNNKILFIKLTVSYLFNIRRKIGKIYCFKKFRKRYLNIKKPKLKTIDNVRINCKDYDLIVLGGDQIWNPNITNGFDDVYFGILNLPNTKFVSYSASVGSDVRELVDINWHDKCKLIDQIGVREKSTYEFLKSKSIEAYLNIDPVFLVSAKEWRYLTHLRTKGSYVFFYVMEMNETIDNILFDLKEKMKLKVVQLVAHGKSKYADDYYYSIDPIDFIGLIDGAEVILTNSFHATAFSIILEKSFYTYPHSTRSERLIDLLDKFNLFNRMIYEPIESYVDVEYNPGFIDHIINLEKNNTRAFFDAYKDMI